MSTSLMRLSAAIPTLGLGVIAVTALISLVFWKKMLRPANYLFPAIACMAVFFINAGTAWFSDLDGTANRLLAFQAKFTTII